MDMICCIKCTIKQLWLTLTALQETGAALTKCDVLLWKHTQMTWNLRIVKFIHIRSPCLVAFNGLSQKFLSNCKVHFLNTWINFFNQIIYPRATFHSNNTKIGWDLKKVHQFYWRSVLNPHWGCGPLHTPRWKNRIWFWTLIRSKRLNFGGKTDNKKKK